MYGSRKKITTTSRIDGSKLELFEWGLRRRLRARSGFALSEGAGRTEPRPRLYSEFSDTLVDDLKKALVRHVWYEENHFRFLKSHFQLMSLDRSFPGVDEGRL